VALRFGTPLPLALVCTEAMESDTESVPDCALSEAPEDTEQFAVAAIDDLSDDAGDPLLSPRRVELKVSTFGVASARGRGVFAADPARSSHGSGLDRPPRA
jgi:hypothetical protein